MAQIAYVDWDGLVYYHKKITQYVNDTLEGCLKDGGYKKFSDIPAPSFETLNYIYIVTTDFVANEFFNDAYKNKEYSEGTVIKVTANASGIYEFTIFNEPGTTGGEYPDIPDNPDIPDDPTPEDPDNPGDDNPPDVEPDSTIADTIIKNSIPMYSINDAGELAVIDFNLLEYTVEERNVAPTESGFYQIKDGDQVIEQGYQQIMILSDDFFPLVALPSSLTIGSNQNCQVKIFSPLSSPDKWVNYQPIFTDDPAVIQEKCDIYGIKLPDDMDSSYKIWAAVNAELNAEILRFIINEQEDI